jgi:hypothetical protein
MKSKLIKTVIKLLTSGELIAHFDANKDGKVTWKELKSAPLSAYLEILLKIGGTLFLVIR